MNDSDNPPNSDSLGSSASCEPLGPFSPPGDYNFEPELQGQPPRAIPATLWPIRKTVREKRTDRFDAWCCFWIGIACLLIGLVWAVLGEFGGAAFGILFGIGLGVEAGLRLILSPRAPAPQSFKYIRDGFPLVVRVVRLELVRTKREWSIPKSGFWVADLINLLPDEINYMDGEEVAAFFFRAVIEYRDPRTGQVRNAWVVSPVHRGEGDDFTTTFHEGDYVTAVYLRDIFRDTLRLYGFLGLRPDLGVVRKGGNPPATPKPKTSWGMTDD